MKILTVLSELNTLTYLQAFPYKVIIKVGLAGKGLFGGGHISIYPVMQAAFMRVAKKPQKHSSKRYKLKRI